MIARINFNNLTRRPFAMPMTTRETDRASAKTDDAFAGNLAYEMRRAKLTKRKLAAKLVEATGDKADKTFSIDRWLKGKSAPYAETLAFLADIFGTTADSMTRADHIERREREPQSTPSAVETSVQQLAEEARRRLTTPDDLAEIERRLRAAHSLSVDHFEALAIDLLNDPQRARDAAYLELFLAYLASSPIRG